MSKLDIAKEWLAEKYTALHGSSRSEWPMDSYHRDLGLLIDFVTDCWPSAEIEKLKADNNRLVESNEHWHLRVGALKTEVEGYPAMIEAETQRVTELICGAMCVLCERHEPVQVDDVGDWVHPWLGGDPCDCDASVVRREMAKGREG